MQQEIQTLKNKNKDLKEENKSHLKIIELLSAGHDNNNPLRIYCNYNRAQTCITSQDHSISSNSSTWNFPRTVSRPRPTDPRPNTLPQLSLTIDSHLYRLNWKILGKIIILTTNLITTMGPTIT